MVSNPVWLKSIRRAADSKPRSSIRKVSVMTTRPGDPPRESVLRLLSSKYKDMNHIHLYNRNLQVFFAVS